MTMTTMLTALTASMIAALLGVSVTLGCDSPPPGDKPVVDKAADIAAPADDAAEKPADPAVVEWLDKLEARGKEMKSLSAEVVYDRENELTTDRQVRIGKVEYRAAAPPDQPSVRFRIDFDKLVVGNALRPQRRDFVFDGSWLVERDHDKKLFQKRQIVAPGERFDPINLNGPFPVPIGQKRKDVLAQFEVTVEADDAELGEKLGLAEPPLHLKLVPKPDAPRAQGVKQFKRVDLWFDRDRLVPVKVVTLEGPNTTTVTLKKVEARDEAGDAKADAKLFDTEPPAAGGGWRVEITPWEK